MDWFSRVGYLFRFGNGDGLGFWGCGVIFYFVLFFVKEEEEEEGWCMVFEVGSGIVDWI